MQAGIARDIARVAIGNDKALYRRGAHESAFGRRGRKAIAAIVGDLVEPDVIHRPAVSAVLLEEIPIGTVDDPIGNPDRADGVPGLLKKAVTRAFADTVVGDEIRDREKMDA